MRSAVESAVEVALPRRGEVTTRDVRAVLGRDLQHADHVDVVVLDAGGGAPVAARIELTLVRSGWSQRRALVCPACREARHLLLARGGTLRCGTCLQYRTRRQAERTCHDFTKGGGAQEDELLRILLSRWRPLTQARLAKARLLVTELLEGDRARLAVLMAQVERLKALAVAT